MNIFKGKLNIKMSKSVKEPRECKKSKQQSENREAENSLLDSDTC